MNVKNSRVAIERIEVDCKPPKQAKREIGNLPPEIEGRDGRGRGQRRQARTVTRRHGSCLPVSAAQQTYITYISRLTVKQLPRLGFFLCWLLRAAFRGIANKLETQLTVMAAGVRDTSRPQQREGERTELETKQRQMIATEQLRLMPLR